METEQKDNIDNKDSFALAFEGAYSTPPVSDELQSRLTAAEQRARKYAKRPKSSFAPYKLPLFSLTMVGLLVGGTTWWKKVSYLPDVKIPAYTLPSPNAYDTLREAAKYKIESEGEIGAAQVSKTTKKSIKISDQPMADRLKLIQKNEKAVALVRLALTQQYAKPLTYSMNDSFAEMAEHRSLARLLYFEGVTYADQGNYDKASQCFLDAMAMGVLIPHHNTLIGLLVGVACESIGKKGLWEIADKLDANTAKNVLIRLQKIEVLRASLSETHEQEKYFGQKNLHMLLQGNPKEMVEKYKADFPTGNDGEESIPGEMSWPKMLLDTLWAGKAVVLEEQSKMREVLIQEAKEPYKPNRIHKEPRYLLNKMTEPIFSGVNFTWYRQRTENNLLSSYIAIQVYKKKYGTYPNTLHKLQALNLPISIVDDFSGAKKSHFGYKKTKEGGFLLYSVGPDGKDDKGVAIDPTKKTSEEGSKLPRHFIVAEDKGDMVARVNTY